MADILNIGVCGADGALATGFPYCDVIKGRPKMVIFADEGFVFNSSDRASSAALAAAVHAGTIAPRGSRLYPIGDLNDFEDKTGEPTFGSIGNLTTKQRKVSDPVPAFDFSHNGGELMHKKLLQLEVGSYEVFLVDSNNAIYGYEDTNGDLRGFATEQNYVYPGKFLGSDAVKQYRFSVSLESYNQFRDLAAFAIADSIILGYTGLRNVVVTLFNQTTNVAKIKLVADGGKNLFDIAAIKTALTTAGSIIATNKQTGTSFTMTSVAASDTTNKVFTCTVDSTAYAALSSGDKVTINLAAPTVLYANGIDGFESTGGVDITKA